MTKRNYLLTAVCLAFATLAYAQPFNLQSPIRLERALESITIDGELNEAAWFAGAPAQDFWQYFPTDSLQAEQQTEIYMTYDDEFLYVAAKCYTTGDAYVVPSLRRDYRAGSSDNISFIFDPFNDRINAVLFGMNPYGVRREALISNGGQDTDGFTTSWDNKWHGEAKIHTDHWICEMAIPFNTLRYNAGVKTWRFNSYRFDTQSNENSTWIRIPRNQVIFNLAFMGEMHWADAPPPQGKNISLIPFVTGSSFQDFEEGDEQPDMDFDVGGDAKVAVTSGLNLDLTVNPDFSQVEVDEQVTNLDRFEIFFPERRQFFLENADLFGSFGTPTINPFFSRRIGISRDTATGQNIQNTIPFGARLSGKLNENWRLGVLNMQTAKDEANGFPSFNYTVTALQRRLFSRSNIGMIFVNKQTFAEGSDTSSLYDPYNRVLGLDYNLASSDNLWSGKIFYHQGFNANGSQQDAFAHGTQLTYSKRAYQLTWAHQWVGENYDAQVGFVPRQGFFRIAPEAQLSFYPNNYIIEHGPGIETSFFWKPEYGQTDQKIDLFYEAEFRDFSEIGMGITNEYVFLFNPFDPTRSGGKELAEGSDYRFTYFGINYRSDRRKTLAFTLNPYMGGYYNGSIRGIEGSFTYRYQPYALISLNYNYNYIDLPEEYATTQLWLVGSRIDLTLSKSVFFTTFVQYNNQLNNININARFQWRFQPVSDFFLVYTDNYFADGLSVRNRALVAKLTYWLNI